MFFQNFIVIQSTSKDHQHSQETFSLFSVFIYFPFYTIHKNKYLTFSRWRLLLVELLEIFSILFSNFQRLRILISPWMQLNQIHILFLIDSEFSFIKFSWNFEPTVMPRKIWVLHLKTYYFFGIHKKAHQHSWSQLDLL